MEFQDSWLLSRLVMYIPLVMSLTVHEWAHAWMAWRLGDDTSKALGRLSLNPLVHLDPIGTVVLPLMGVPFGWAKPVPVNPFNLRNPRVADFWISAAGPISNFGLAIIFGTIFRFVAYTPLPEGIHLFLYFAVLINISLACFNLIPLFPLDGSHILRNLLPESYGPALDKFDTISPFILIILIIVGAFWIILGPMVTFFFYLFTGVSLG